MWITGSYYKYIQNFWVYLYWRKKGDWIFQNTDFAILKIFDKNLHKYEEVDVFSTTSPTLIKCRGVGHDVLVGLDSFFYSDQFTVFAHSVIGTANLIFTEIHSNAFDKFCKSPEKWLNLKLKMFKFLFTSCRISKLFILCACLFLKLAIYQLLTKKQHELSAVTSS